MKKENIILFILFIFMILFIDNVHAATLPYECTYTAGGKNSSKSLKIEYSTVIDDGNGHELNYPTYKVTYNGKTKTFPSLFVEGNIFPTSKCEDVFYSKSKNKVFAVDKDSFYYVQTIGQYCATYDDLKQFCNGTCKIDNVPCGNETTETKWGTCPAELLPAIKFLKIVVINTLQIFVPIILILMGTIDMARAVMSSDDKGIKEGASKFIRRAITAVIVFFITTIVTIIMDALAKADINGFEDWKACWFYDSDDKNSTGSNGIDDVKEDQLYYCNAGNTGTCIYGKDLKYNQSYSDCKPVSKCPIK